MMKNLSLKQKILLSVVIALSLVILLLSWQSYTSQKSLLLQGSQEQVQRLGSQQAASVSDWLAARRDVIQALGNKPVPNPSTPCNRRKSPAASSSPILARAAAR